MEKQVGATTVVALEVIVVASRKSTVVAKDLYHIPLLSIVTLRNNRAVQGDLYI